MKMLFPLQDRPGIFGDLGRQALCRRRFDCLGRIVLAHGYALSATDTEFVVDDCNLFFIKGNSPLTAIHHALAASRAIGPFYDRFGIRVKLQFSSHTGRAHPEIFQGASESRHFMAFEMRHGHQHIGFGNGRAYEGFPAILPSWNGNHHLVCSSEPIGNNDRSPGNAYGIESVQVSYVQMVHGIGTPTAVQGIGIGQKSPGTHLPQQFHHPGRIIVTYKSQIPAFSKMDLDGRKFILAIKPLNSGGLDKQFQLFGQTHAGT